MKTLIIYDSMYGNTEQIAKSIGGAITGDEGAKRYFFRYRYENELFINSHN